MVKRSGSVYWGAMVLDTFDLLLKAKLNGNDLKVFLYLCSQMNQQNNICYDNQKTISHFLEIHKSSVSKSIKILSKNQFIVKSLTPKGFMINPNLFYVSKRNREDRESLRDVFEACLEVIDQKSFFSLNEDFNRLEVDYEK